MEQKKEINKVFQNAVYTRLTQYLNIDSREVKRGH